MITWEICFCQDESNKTPASARHKRGCNCKKSSCLKKYCECYQVFTPWINMCLLLSLLFSCAGSYLNHLSFLKGGVGCSISCRCEGVKMHLEERMVNFTSDSTWLSWMHTDCLVSWLCIWDCINRFPHTTFPDGIDYLCFRVLSIRIRCWTRRRRSRNKPKECDGQRSARPGNPE